MVNCDWWMCGEYIQIVCVCVCEVRKKNVGENKKEKSECVLDLFLGDFLILFSSIIELVSARRFRSIWELQFGKSCI